MTTPLAALRLQTIAELFAEDLERYPQGIPTWRCKQILEYMQIVVEELSEVEEVK